MTTTTAFHDTLERIARGQHVSLTTYRKDGRAVAAPCGSSGTVNS